MRKDEAVARNAKEMARDPRYLNALADRFEEATHLSEKQKTILLAVLRGAASRAQRGELLPGENR